MRCSVNRLLQLATKPRLQSMRSDTSSHVWPSASSKISRARRASSARFVRLLARRVSSISSEFDNVMASLMDAIIVYKWLFQSTRMYDNKRLSFHELHPFVERVVRVNLRTLNRGFVIVRSRVIESH